MHEGTQKPIPMREAVAELVKEFDTWVEYINHTAKLTRIKFQALKSEGFTDEQALKLCEKIFP